MTPLEELHATQRDDLEFQADMDQGDFLDRVTPEQAIADLTNRFTPYETALMRQINRRNR